MSGAIGKEEAEKEFKDVLYYLRCILRGTQTPISVSFLNSTFASRFRKKSLITEDFMRNFKGEFMFLTIGEDIKIQLKGDLNQSELVLAEYQREVNELKKILSKDSDKANIIKKKMLLTKSMSFKDFVKKFSSRKHVVSYPFLFRNSHIFNLRAANGETYVEIVEGNNVVLTEPEFWKIVQSEGLKKVVLRNVLNFFRKFYHELNQGKLQVCFNYGRSIVIDKTFMAENSEYFEKTENGDMLFKLKEKYREPEDSVVDTTTPVIIKNKDKDISNEVLNEVKKQNSVDEVTSTGDKSQEKIETSVMNRESKSNSDNESESYSDTDFRSSFSKTEDGDMNEFSKRTNQLSWYKEENIQEKTQNQLCISEKCENENTSGTLNKKYASSCLPNSKLDSQKNEAKETEENQKDGEEENSIIKQIRKAIEEKRSFVFVGASEKKPVLIGERTGSTEEKKAIKKINHFLFKLNEKYREPEVFLVEATAIAPTKSKDKDSSKEVLNEVKKQNPGDERKPTGDESELKVESHVMNRESKSNSDNESEMYSDTDFESSSSEDEDDNMNESSKKVKKLSMYKVENIQEETQTPGSFFEKSENGNTSRTSNKNYTRSCPPKSELEEHAQKDETEKKKNTGEEECNTLKKIKKALEENRSFVFVGASDRDPILIGERTRSTEEKKAIKKIIQCLIKEL